MSWLANLVSGVKSGAILRRFADIHLLQPPLALANLEEHWPMSGVSCTLKMTLLVETREDFSATHAGGPAKVGLGMFVQHSAQAIVFHLVFPRTVASSASQRCRVLPARG